MEKHRWHLRITRIAVAAWTTMTAVAYAADVPSSKDASDDGAQITTYPNQPIRIIVPYAAGGLPDMIARLLGSDLTSRLGQPFIIENRPGANGTIGTGLLARSKPDGYTLGVVASSHVFGRALMPHLPYDPIKDFAPITMAVTTPIVLTASGTLPVTTLADFIQYAKERPGQLTFASAGTGSNTHVYGRWFTDMANIQMVHIPYKGAAPAHVDLIAGRVALSFDTLAAAQPYIDSGKLKLLAVGGDARLPEYPQVPTVKESGYPKFEAQSWSAVLAPAGTPPAIVEKLNRAIVAALQTPEIKEKLTLAGAQVVADSPEQAKETLVRDEQRLGALIKSMNITLE